MTGIRDARREENTAYLWLSSRRVECSLTRSYPTLAPRPQIGIAYSLVSCLWQFRRTKGIQTVVFCLLKSCIWNISSIEAYSLIFNFPTPAKDSPQSEKISYICGLRARIECEPLGEYSTRSDRVTNIGYLLTLRASVLLLPAANSYFRSRL